MPTTLFLAEGLNLLDPAGAGNFIWTLVIFLVALPVMWKMVFARIAGALNERDAKASEAIVAAERASEAAEAARAEVEVKLGEAQTEAAKMLSDAKERAEVRERDIVDNAKKEADAMIEAARSAIEAEKDKALTAIRAEVVDLSMAAASKVLGRNVGSEDDRRLVQEMVGAGAPPSGGDQA
jgi:F-type H+-transporting ATPase subunit b